MDKPTILIVDDEPMNINLLAQILSDKNDIRVATSGEEALKIAKSNRLDLILLDIFMPEMDGFEVAKELKSDRQTKDIPIIFITADTDEKNVEKAYLIGGSDYITKPLKVKELLARVDRELKLNHLIKNLEEKNRDLKRYTQIINENVITSSTDLKGVITYVSEAFVKISGYTFKELIGSNHKIVRHPDMSSEIFKDLWNHLKADKAWECEIQNLRKDGTSYWVKSKIEPLYNKNKKIGYISIRQDITDKKLIERLSVTDALTQIYNRGHFNDVFEREIKRNKRDGKYFSFLVMDIDHFKQYNDTYGHQAGDEVLIKFAKSLKESLNRGSDFAFRLGGEEFGILFSDLNQKRSLEFANFVRESIENLKIEHSKNSASAYITASMGLVVQKGEEILSDDEIYKLADDALYKAKESGRNRVVIND